jgi:hypothetical protein
MSVSDLLQKVVAFDRLTDYRSGFQAKLLSSYLIIVPVALKQAKVLFSYQHQCHTGLTRV